MHILDAIKTQFHHLIRTVPACGTIIYPAADAQVADLLSRGNWSRGLSFGSGPGAEWRIKHTRQDLIGEFGISCAALGPRRLSSRLIGEHNRYNASAAYIAAHVAGITPTDIERGLESFNGVKRRLELIAQVDGVRLYDDFAHHPTAIAASLQALRDAVGDARIICVLEPRSNTMRSNVHTSVIAQSLAQADSVFIYSGDGLEWQREAVLSGIEHKSHWLDEIDTIVAQVCIKAAPGDHIVIMSNGGFGGIHERMKAALQTGSLHHG